MLINVFFLTQRACTTEAKWTVLPDRTPVFTARKMIFTTDWSVMRIPVKKVHPRNLQSIKINQDHGSSHVWKSLPIGSDATRPCRGCLAAYLLNRFKFDVYTLRLFIIIEHVTNFRYYLINVTTNCESRLSRRYHRNERQEITLRNVHFADKSDSDSEGQWPGRTMTFMPT